MTSKYFLLSYFILQISFNAQVFASSTSSGSVEHSHISEIILDELWVKVLFSTNSPEVWSFGLTCKKAYPFLIKNQLLPPEDQESLKNMMSLDDQIILRMMTNIPSKKSKLLLKKLRPFYKGYYLKDNPNEQNECKILWTKLAKLNKIGININDEKSSQIYTKQLNWASCGMETKEDLLTPLGFGEISPETYVQKVKQAQEFYGDLLAHEDPVARNYMIIQYSKGIRVTKNEEKVAYWGAYKGFELPEKKLVTFFSEIYIFRCRKGSKADEALYHD